jgi:hypothetical protein
MNTDEVTFTVLKSPVGTTRRVELKKSPRHVRPPIARSKVAEGVASDRAVVEQQDLVERTWSIPGRQDKRSIVGSRTISSPSINGLTAHELAHVVQNEISSDLQTLHCAPAPPKLVDKNVKSHEPGCLVDPIIQPFEKQRRLLAIRSLDEALHRDLPPKIASELYHAEAFSHSLDPKPTFDATSTTSPLADPTRSCSQRPAPRSSPNRPHLPIMERQEWHLVPSSKVVRK